MRRITAIVLIAVLLLMGGCAPKEPSFQPPQNATLITLDPSEMNNPSEDPNNPSEEPNDPNEEPSNPNEEPSDPNEEPSNPNEEPSDPNEEPSNPNEEPSNPNEEPSNPNEEPSNPSGPSDPNWTTSCMTFNVLKDRNPGTEYPDPDVRAPWILETIVKYSPDLLGLQELTKVSSTGWNMYEYLTVELGKQGYAFSGLLDSAGKSGSVVAVDDYTIASGLVIMWKKDRFELKDYGAMVFSNDSKRHYQWVKLYDKQESIDILMTNAHFSTNPKDGSEESNSTKGDQLRTEQGNTLNRFWEQNCKEGMALYSTGDYNAGVDTNPDKAMSTGRFMSTRAMCIKANANAGIDRVYINTDVQDCYEFYRCNETFEPEGVEKSDPNNRNERFCASDHYAVISYCSNAYR